ncbi:MAG: LamG-like jellyroll fold domain-containing protein [Flavobacterium sp.]
MKKKLLISIFSFTIFWAQTPIYKFEFNNSRTDASGNHTFSTIPGSSFVADRFGVANQALQMSFMDPTSVNLPLLPVGTSTRSVSFWMSFRNGSPAADRIFLFQYGTQSTNQAFGLVQAPAQMTAFGWASDINTAVSERYRYRTYGNNWYHYVMTYDGTTCKVYRNGNLYINALPPSVWNTVGTTFQLGSSLSTPNSVNRTVVYDDLEIFDTVLTETDIQNMYASQVIFDSTGLVAYFPFDGNLTDFDGEHAFSSFPSAFPGGIFVTGYSGQGVSFDLGQGFMNTSMANSMNNNNLTICYWQKRSVIPNTSVGQNGEALVEAFGSFGVRERKLSTDANPIERLAYFRNSASEDVLTRLFLKNLNQWHHVAIQFVNSGNNRFLLYFIDGEFVAAEQVTDNSSIHRFNSVFSIGTGTQLSSSGAPAAIKYAQSVLDELYIFNRALTVPEIMAIRYQNASTLSNHSLDMASIDVNVFPNPFTSHVLVKSEFIGDIRYEVIDLTGKSILHGTSNQPNFIIDHLDQLHKGIYLLLISDSNGNQKSQKIVK